MSEHFVRGLSFDPDSGGYVIEYLTPAVDVRSNGLVLNHALLIPAEEPFEDLLIDLVQALRSALDHGLALHQQASGLQLDEDDSEDAPGPYDHPER